MNQLFLLVNPIGGLFHFLFVSVFLNYIGLRLIIAEVRIWNDQEACSYEQRILSVELAEFSFQNQLEYAVEVLIFVKDKNGNYPDHVVEVVVIYRNLSFIIIKCVGGKTDFRQ